jgi:hypothetical protein
LGGTAAGFRTTGRNAASFAAFAAASAANSASATSRKCFRTLSATSFSTELECVFFSVTPAWGK